METERFFAELASRMEEARQKDRMTYQHFFAELEPRLDTARALESELDRHLARRFNVLDYVRTDELGLSNILADLLDPRGPHGQGTFFLERFVEGLGERVFRPDLGTGRISVAVEKVIPSNRRIDVYVQSGNGNLAWCLAIENKPYAGDQENQVNDYLKFLKDEYGERFVLIYLSPKGEGPSNWSIRKEELGKWKGRLAILPYCTADSDQDQDGKENQRDRFADFRLHYSLADWFEECRRSCEVDRLRWFLRDAEVFCQRTFGGPTMTTDSETKALRDYLLSNPEKNLPIARTVYKSWPPIRDEICRNFFDRLCRRVEIETKEAMSDFADDLHVAQRYWGVRKWTDCFWLYRMSWRPYGEKHSPSKGRTAICMEVEEKSPNGWLYGVVCPKSQDSLSQSDKKRRVHLIEKLHAELGAGTKSTVWPWWKYVDQRYGNWDYLVADLYRECDQGDRGEVMNYFVDLLVETAKKVIPIINEIEGDKA